MSGELIITVLLVTLAVFVLYKNLKKKSSGECGCCSGDKPRRKFSRK